MAQGEGLLHSTPGSESVSIRYSNSESGLVDVVEVVKGLLGKDILESSSSEVSASKSHVRNALGLPGTGRLSSLWLVEWKGIGELEQLGELG